MRKEGWRGRLITFLHDLESGKFDPDLNEPEPETSPSVKETPTNGENSTETNGTTSTVAEDRKPSGADDEMQFNIDVDEDAGGNEATRADANGKSSIDSTRPSRGEETSVLPEGNQVMIRTIPPDIGRVKLEDVRCPLFVL